MFIIECEEEEWDYLFDFPDFIKDAFGEWAKDKVLFFHPRLRDMNDTTK